MRVEAAVRGDVTLLHDPLTTAVCNPEEIWQIRTLDALEQNKPWPDALQTIPLRAKRKAWDDEQ